MAAGGAKRIRRLLAVDHVDDVDHVARLRRFFETAIALVIPDPLAHELDWVPDGRSVLARVTKCSSHDGVGALGSTVPTSTIAPSRTPESWRAGVDHALGTDRSSFCALTCSGPASPAGNRSTA
jgi:hypothetical protein